MPTLRLIASPASIKKFQACLDTQVMTSALKGLELQAISAFAMREICQEHRVALEITSISDFLQHHSKDSINLMWDGQVEPFLYSRF